MHVRKASSVVSLIALAITLNACGGGGGGSGLNSAPPPISGPTPTPTPPPGPPPLTYTGPIGLVSSEPFATYGYANPGAGSTPNSADSIEFKYIAANNRYEILLPGFERGLLETIFHNGTVCSNGSVCDPSGTGSLVTVGSTSTRQDVLVSLPVPRNNDYPLPGLTYTSFGEWSDNWSNPANASRYGLFAYGIATAAGDVPTSGIGTYGATVLARTSNVDDFINGSATFVFDFNAGSLSGSMKTFIADGWDMHPLAEYAFTNTVFGVGSRTFSGSFLVPNSTASSSFEGAFNGPQAAELMARWHAPYLNPFTNTWGTMFGVMLGKKK